MIHTHTRTHTHTLTHAHTRTHTLTHTHTRFLSLSTHTHTYTHTPIKKISEVPWTTRSLLENTLIFWRLFPHSLRDFFSIVGKPFFTIERCLLRLKGLFYGWKVSFTEDLYRGYFPIFVGDKNIYICAYIYVYIHPKTHIFMVGSDMLLICIRTYACVYIYMYTFAYIHVYIIPERHMFMLNSEVLLSYIRTYTYTYL